MKAQSLLLIAAALWLGCTTSRPVTTPFSFVFLADTGPRDPFETEAEFLKEAYEKISHEGLNYVFHGGNSAYGGLSLNGIRAVDLTEHFKKNMEYMKRLKNYTFIAPGPKDLHDKTLKVFKQAASPLIFQSFNYGRLHIVVMALFKGMNEDAFKITAARLKKNLESSGYPPTLIISYGAPDLDGDEKSHRPLKEILKIVKKCPSVTFISASGKKAQKITDKKISSLVLPCGGFFKKGYRYRYETTYYVVDCKGTDCKYRPVNIHK